MCAGVASEVIFSFVLGFIPRSTVYLRLVLFQVHAKPGPIRIMVAPSRKKVRCGYANCGFNGESRTLKRHMKIRHPGLPIRLQNDGFGQGGRWESWRVAAQMDSDPIQEGKFIIDVEVNMHSGSTGSQNALFYPCCS